MGCQPGTTELFARVDDMSDGTDKRYGCYNPGSRTDSNRAPSLHAEGRAFDLYVEPDQRKRDGEGQRMFRWLYDNRYTLGLHELIWDWQIWTLARDREGVRFYGVNGHVDHIHCGMTWAGALGRLPTYTSPAPGIADPAPMEEDDMVIIPTGARRLSNGRLPSIEWDPKFRVLNCYGVHLRTTYQDPHTGETITWGSQQAFYNGAAIPDLQQFPADRILIPDVIGMGNNTDGAPGLVLVGNDRGTQDFLYVGGGNGWAT